MILDINEKLEQVYRINIYKTNQSGTPYAESEVYDTELKRFMNPIPVSIDFFEQFHDEKKGIFFDLIPNRVLNFSKKKIVFRSESKKVDIQIYDKKVNVTIPKMIYKLINGDIYVFAYKKYLGLNTKLYHVPLPNINTSGKVCTGNYQLEDSENGVVLMQEIERFFLLSKFTHSNNDLLSKKFFDEIDGKDLRKELKPKSIKLKSII